MVLRVQYALDSNNNVGVFSCDLKEGESNTIFKDESVENGYRISLINNSGELFVKVFNPETDAKGEPSKIYKKGEANEVFTFGQTTIMIMSIQSGGSGEQKSPQPVAVTPKKPVGAEDSVSIQGEVDVDPSNLPPVEGSKLQYDYEFDEPEKPVKKEQPADPAPPKPQTKEKIRTKEQLLISDVRDRRYYLKGATYSLRNKISALVLSLGALSIGTYSIAVSEISKKAQRALFADGLSGKAAIIAQDLKSKIQNHHNVVSSVINVLSDERADSNVLNSFSHFDFMIGAASFRLLTHQEVFPPDAPNSEPTRKVANLGGHSLQMVEMPGAPSTLPADVKRLDDGSYVKSLVQWSNAEVIRQLGFSREQIQSDQLRTGFDSLRRGIGFNLFNRTNLGLPNDNRGIFTFIVRSDSNPNIFVLVQTSNRFIENFIKNSEGANYYIMAHKTEVLYPTEVKQDNLLAEDLGYYLRENRLPASEDHSMKAIPINSHWDLVAVPSVNMKTAFSSNKFYIYAVVIMGIFFFSAVMFSRSITFPLTSLIRQIEAVAAGNYVRRIHVDSNDEVGQVSDYLEHLTAQLTKKEQDLARVTDLASRDSLTDLFNHRHFRSQLEKNWDAIRKSGKGALILIDLDDFSLFNHEHGHIQGDNILKEFAGLIKSSISEEHLIARYSGEEFVIWAPDLDQKTAFELSENIIKKTREHKYNNLTGGSPFTMLCSIGVTTLNKVKHTSVDQFLADGDNNVTMAKKAGKNRVWAGAV